MDCYFIDQQRAPIYNNYNAKSQKQIDINQSNNNYTNRINHKNVKPYRKEALSGEKIQTKKYKTSKNSPVKNLPETYREYSKENKHPLKMSQNNEIIKNTKNHTEIFDICFIKRMKGIYPKKSNQPIYRPNSNSLLMNQCSNKNYTDRLMGNSNNNSKYKKYDFPMNNSGIMKGKKMNYDINPNTNSNFYNKNNLYNYYNNINSFEENENKNNYSNNNNNVYCSINVCKKGINSYGHMNNSSSMKMLFSKKAYNNYMNKYNNIYNKNINESNNNNYDDLDINLENENKMNNNSSNKKIETYNNKKRFQSNCNLVKNNQKLVKNYVNNNNSNSFRPSFNHNYDNYKNSNYNLNEKIINKIYSHQRMKSNEDSSLMLNYQKDRNVSAINYLQNSMKFKKDYPKYMLKYTNNNQDNNSGINKKLNTNMIDSYDINNLSNDISGIIKTSRLTSNKNNNKLEEEIYMNNDLANIEVEPFPNHQKIINYPIKSIERYINMNQVNNLIKNNINKEMKKDKSTNNIINRNIYINNNFNSSVKIKTKQNTHNNTPNNSENKIKIKKQNMSSKMNKANNQQIKGYSEKNNNNNNMLRSSSSNFQKTTQFSSTNNIYNCDKIKSTKNTIQSSNKNQNNLDTNSNMSNFNNINNISVSQSNYFNTIYDKKNFTANNFMIKDYKSKDKEKDKNKYTNNSLSNNVSSNKIVNYSNNNSTNNLDFGKEVYQKKKSQKDYRTTFNSMNNSKSKSKNDDYLNSHNNNNSSIKSEGIKSRLIKSNVPMTNFNNPSDKKNKNYYYIISNNNNINNIKNSELYNLNNYLDNNIKNIDNNEKNKKIKEEIIKNNEKLENKKSSSIKNDYYKDKVINENNKNDYLKENKVINNNDKNNQTNKNDLNSEVTSSCKTNEFENRNMSEFPVNDNIIKSKVEEHNNLYMNENNIMALNEKNNENFEKLKESSNFKISTNLINIINSKDDINKEKDTEKDEMNNTKQSKQSIQTKETKEIFKSIHDSDTLIDKDKHLPQLHQLYPEISHSKTKIDKKNNIPFDKSKIINKELKINTLKNIDINNINNVDSDRKLIKKEKEKEKEEKIIFDNNKETLSQKEKIIFNNNEINSEKENNEENDNESKETKNIDNNIGIIDLNFLQNNIIKEEDKKEKNDITKDNKEENSIKESQANIEDPLLNKNQREINKLNQKKSGKEKNYELIKNMYKNDMLCEPINANNPKGNSINNLSKHIFTTSITKDCDYYQNEQEKLSAYIKNYYKENGKYPKSDINFYLYGRQIGHGAFGQVNLALHIASGRLVAIKIFNKKNLKNTRAKQKIKNEVEMLSHFHHPFINQILDNFETDTHIFIVMEYVCGDLLGFIRKRGKLSESVGKIIFKQLIEGLKYIHKKKVVHRDIKLDNILIDLTNTIKICDFGVSRKFTDKDELMHEHCGTPAYIAPEIFENHGYKGTACDIWSAGVTLYYMLGGVQPFKANSILELEKIIMSGDYKELEDVSKEANKLIKGMLQVNPKKRFRIDDILGHPWLDKVDLNQRQKLNLFTEAEKILMSKFDVDYLNSDKSELIENFTMKNLDSDKISKNNGNTKSLIFAPYNSYIENENNEELSFEEDKDYKDLKVLNDICKFGWRVQQANIQYELSNNGDFDNGLIKTQKEEDFKKENEKIEKVIENKSKNEKKWVNSPRGSDSEDEADVIQINQDIVDKIEKEVGYNKSYIIESINKNKINYATATYYLLARENLYNYQSNCTEEDSK